MILTLVILAAGMGSRYGGLKQVDPMGPSGETVLDYSVHDAIRAGFGRVVFIIRRDFEAEFRATVGARFADRVQVDYVFQGIDVLPPGFSAPAGRVKPWGTGHAVWCAREAISGPFAVINADDFYGASAFEQLATFLRDSQQSVPPAYALVGYRLDKTLSDFGAVARGVCTVGADGFLVEIEEQTGILASEVGPHGKYAADTVVSMNFWGFNPSVLPLLEALLIQFLSEHGAAEKTEFYLPIAVDQLLRAGTARVRVLPTESQWFGVTYREDKPLVMAAIAELCASGVYGSPLWAPND